MTEVGDAKKVVVSPYRLNLVPGEEQRRSQWDLLFISDIPVTVDFHHTDMLERVITIKKADSAVKKMRRKLKDDKTRKERRHENKNSVTIEAEGEKAQASSESIGDGNSICRRAARADGRPESGTGMAIKIYEELGPEGTSARRNLES